MTILDRPPPEWKRPTTPCRVKCQVLMNQLGRSTIDNERLGTVENTHFDHRPPLEQRKFDTKAWDTIPPANDPAHIEAITVAQHDRRTNGPGGTKRITTRGSDAGNRAKDRAVISKHQNHQDALKAKSAGRPRPKSKKPKQQIRGRSSFPTGRGFQSRAAE